MEAQQILQARNRIDEAVDLHIPDSSGPKTIAVPVVGAGKLIVDESEKMSSRLKQINAAQDTIILSLPQPQTTL